MTANIQIQVLLRLLVLTLFPFHPQLDEAQANFLGLPYIAILETSSSQQISFAFLSADEQETKMSLCAI
ncbi:MAG TPA: hypothetical protein DCW55_03405 [Candidatus Pacebacteria bacterium]|nr:hypothetical protein [Candidatus Paceibacterota bacterium]HAX01784.1 hypothetical protein [Candidatus Paceibacterota bacterium]